MINQSYVYVLFRPNGIPCYVGKGKGNRWLKHERHATNPHLANIIFNAGRPLPKIRTAQNLSGKDALELEQLVISVIGREGRGGPLVNLTDGGEGTCGYQASEEWKRHRSIKAKEIWLNPTYLEKQKKRMKGNKVWENRKPYSQERIDGLRKQMAGNSYTKGMKHTEAAKEKMRLVHSDPDFKKKLKAARYASGMYSPEACAKRWISRRAKKVAAIT